MKVSVAMATYNGAKYLLEQLDSLLCQTTPIDEVIICDDGSSDKTCEIVQNFIAENQLAETWHFIQNEDNLGYGENFHKAANLTTGDAIFFCDQDDVWRKDKVAVCIECLHQNEKIQLLCTDFDPLVSSSDAPNLGFDVKADMSCDGSLQRIEFNYKNIFIRRLGCTMAVRSEFLRRIQPFWFEGWAHDECVWKLAQIEDGCYVLHEPLLQRRLHSDNVSMRKKHEKELRLRAMNELRKGHEAALLYGLRCDVAPGKINILEDNIESLRLRIELIESQKYVNILYLTKHLKCYQYKRSYIKELQIALQL